MKNTTKKLGKYACIIVIIGIILVCGLMHTKYEGLVSQDTTDQIQKICANEITHLNELKTYILDSTTINNTDKDNLNTDVVQIQTSTQNYCQYWSDHVVNTNDIELQKYVTAMQDHKKILLNYVKNTNSISVMDKDNINIYMYAQYPDNKPKNVVTSTVVPDAYTSFQNHPPQNGTKGVAVQGRAPPGLRPTRMLESTVIPTKNTGFMSDPDIKWSKGQNWTPVPEFTSSAMAPLQQSMPTLSSGTTTGLGDIVNNTKSMMSNVQGNQSNVYKLFGKS